jgi:NitT/TauT family transport system substrate-binding protein
MPRLAPLFAILLSIVATQANAATPLSILYTAAPSFLASYVAQDQGIFTRHGLAVTLTTAINPSTSPAALVSGSTDIAGLQTIVLLQAADNGLDLVTVAGTEAYPAPYHQGLLARKGANIAGPADMIGKRLGVPGVGATMDILARKLFATANVPDDRVTRVEIALQSMTDALRGGSIDAVVAVDPTFSRIIDSGVGTPAGSWDSFIPKGTFLSLYAADRDWAASHADTLAAFRDALDEATRLIADPANAAATRDSMTRCTRLPPTVVNAMELPRSLTTKVTPESLEFWGKIGMEQKLLSKVPDLTKIIAR